MYGRCSMAEKVTHSDVTAEEAIQTKAFKTSTPFVCPFPDCRVYAQHHWGVVQQLTVKHGPNASSGRGAGSANMIELALCEHCKREVVYVDRVIVWPRASTAPLASADMPDDVALDFNEARQIHQQSPRGAAALL